MTHHALRTDTLEKVLAGQYLLPQAYQIILVRELLRLRGCADVELDSLYEWLRDGKDRLDAANVMMHRKPL